jgi:hypothetical protein
MHARLSYEWQRMGRVPITDRLTSLFRAGLHRSAPQV